MIPVTPKLSLSSAYTAVLVAFVCFSLLGLRYKGPSPIEGKPQVYDYGMEYAQIAASLANGNGYGNVFAENSGPSAWQPPMVTLIFAGVFALFGAKSFTSFWVLAFIRTILLTATVYILQKTVDLTRYTRLKPLVAAIFIGLTIFNHKSLIGGVDDVPFTIFLGAFTVYQLVALFEHKLQSNWGILMLAVVLPLTQPSFSMILVIGMVIHLVSQLIKNASGKSLFEAFRLSTTAVTTSVVSGLLFLASLGSWAAYNYSVFQKPVLFKSNMWFEFYLANVLDDDGILSRQTFSSYHPYKEAPLLQDYLRQGEMNFLDSAKILSENFLAKTPEVYQAKMANRLKNAFLYTQPISDVGKVEILGISDDDLQQLKQAGLVSDKLWLCLKWPQKDVEAALQNLAIANPEAVLADWEDKRAQMQKNMNKWNEKVRGILMGIFPIACMALGLLFASVRRSFIFWGVVGAYILYLMPYIFISHFERYQLSALSLQTLAIFLPLAAAFEKWGKPVFTQPVTSYLKISRLDKPA